MSSEKITMGRALIKIGEFCSVWEGLQQTEHVISHLESLAECLERVKSDDFVQMTKMVRDTAGVVAHCYASDGPEVAQTNAESNERLKKQISELRKLEDACYPCYQLMS